MEGTHVDVCRQFINGEWCEAAAIERFAVTNSSTGDVIAQTPLSGAKDVEAAVRAAADAFPKWAETPVAGRVQVLYRYKALLERHFDELARQITIEHGKTMDEARGEVFRTVEVVELACAMPMLIKGETLDTMGGGVDYQTTRYPLGVCAGITPCNFPSMIPHWMFPVAIACGNTFVLKPSHQTPLTSLRYVQLLHEAGLPPGVVNLVHGAKAAVDALLEHPLVRAASFVGTTPVAHAIYQTGALHGKRIQAAGGAKNHAVIMPDAPLELTVDNVMSSAFGCAGQRCMAVATVILVEGAEKVFLEPLSRAVAALKVGPTDRDDTVGMGSAGRMGPVVSKEHMNRVRGYIATGEREGAVLLHDGRDIRVPGFPNGFYVGPTLFDQVLPEHTIARDEIFGPVLNVMRLKDLDAAIEQINTGRYGNAACIFTRSGTPARAFRSRVTPGMIGVNVGLPAPSAFFPFSGWKESFFGDLHVQGLEGMLFYTQQKVVMARWV